MSAVVPAHALTTQKTKPDLYPAPALQPLEPNVNTTAENSVQTVSQETTKLISLHSPEISCINTDVQLMVKTQQFVKQQEVDPPSAVNHLAENQGLRVNIVDHGK